MIVVVVNRVVDAVARVEPAEADVDGRNAVVLQERRVIGTGSERRNPQIRRGIALRFAPLDPLAMARACARFQTVSVVSGSSTSRATALTSCSSECDPDGLKNPRPCRRS